MLYLAADVFCFKEDEVLKVVDERDEARYLYENSFLDKMETTEAMHFARMKTNAKFECTLKSLYIHQAILTTSLILT